MSASEPLSFEQYLETLAPLRGQAESADPAAQAAIHEAAQALLAVRRTDRRSLAEQIGAHPDWVPVLGLVVGLSRERLKNELRHAFGTSGWVTLAKTRADELVAFLDDEFRLVATLAAQRARSFSLGDVLVARAESRQSAGRAVGRGRSVEDAIEAVAERLGVPFELRTRFSGRSGLQAPCDLAIPGGGDSALIVCAAKGFDSTGSKLTDAVREIEQMAEVRLPRQFVYAVVDGIGWHSRQADLRRIHRLWETRRIDGLYSLAMLNLFARDLAEALGRLGIRQT